MTGATSRFLISYIAPLSAPRERAVMWKKVRRRISLIPRAQRLKRTQGDTHRLLLSCGVRAANIYCFFPRVACGVSPRNRQLERESSRRRNRPTPLFACKTRQRIENASPQRNHHFRRSSFSYHLYKRLKILRENFVLYYLEFKI